MADEWREGPARVFDPADKCPVCPDGGEIVFASDFKKFGKRSIRVCLSCRKVWDFQTEQGPVLVHERKAP